jgi:hypothetical protein
MTPKTVLLIPDTHAMPGDKLDRFGKMMAFLEDRNVYLDRVVHIGDLWDFGSLCTHDMDDPRWSHRSLQADIDAGFDALDWIASIAAAYGGAPIDFIEGNHEDRYNKWMASDNRLLTSEFPKTVKQLVAQRRPTLGVKYHNFLKPVTIHGQAAGRGTSREQSVTFAACLDGMWSLASAVYFDADQGRRQQDPRAGGWLLCRSERRLCLRQGGQEAVVEWLPSAAFLCARRVRRRVRQS